MIRETGMRSTEIWSEDAPVLEKKHQLPLVKVMTYRDLGDGWVLNAGNHLAGSLVQMRRFRVRNGSQRTKYEFIPVDNIVPQLTVVDDSITSYTERISGSETGEGEHVPGEVEKLIDYRFGLYYKTLSPEQEQEAKDFLGSMADERARAVNPLEYEVGRLAELMRNLKDRIGRRNIGATLMRSHPLERKLNERFVELNKNLEINDDRKARYKRWFFNESQSLQRAEAAFKRLLGEEDTDLAFGDLVGISREQTVRPQIFNQFAYSLEQTGGQVEDKAQITVALSGLVAIAFNSYLLKPFRIVSKKKGEAKSKVDISDEELKIAIEDRQAVLEDLSLEGPYHQRRGKLLTIGGAVLDAINHKDWDAAAKLSVPYKWQIHYYIDDAKDPTSEMWYGHRL